MFAQAHRSVGSHTHRHRTSEQRKLLLCCIACTPNAFAVAVVHLRAKRMGCLRYAMTTSFAEGFLGAVCRGKKLPTGVLRMPNPGFHWSRVFEHSIDAAADSQDATEQD